MRWQQRKGDLERFHHGRTVHPHIILGLAHQLSSRPALQDVRKPMKHRAQRAGGGSCVLCQHQHIAIDSRLRIQRSAEVAAATTKYEEHLNVRSHKLWQPGLAYGLPERRLPGIVVTHDAKCGEYRLFCGFAGRALLRLLRQHLPHRSSGQEPACLAVRRRPAVAPFFCTVN